MPRENHAIEAPVVDRGDSIDVPSSQDGVEACVPAGAGWTGEFVVEHSVEFVTPLRRESVVDAMVVEDRDGCGTVCVDSTQANGHGCVIVGRVVSADAASLVVSDRTEALCRVRFRRDGDRVSIDGDEPAGCVLCGVRASLDAIEFDLSDGPATDSERSAIRSCRRRVGDLDR